MQKKHSKRSSQKPVDLGMIDPKALEDNIGRMSLSSKDEDEEETPKESPSFKKLSTAAKGSYRNFLKKKINIVLQRLFFSLSRRAVEVLSKNLKPFTDV